MRISTQGGATVTNTNERDRKQTPEEIGAEFQARAKVAQAEDLKNRACWWCHQKEGLVEFVIPTIGIVTRSRWVHKECEEAKGSTENLKRWGYHYKEEI